MPIPRKNKLANPQKKRSYQEVWRLANGEKQRELTKAWALANPEKRADYRHRRRARAHGAEISVTAQDTKEILQSADGICSYCLQKFDRLTQDHVIPVAHGGPHSFNNIVGACRRCNSKKAARGPLSMLPGVFWPQPRASLSG